MIPLLLRIRVRKENHNGVNFWFPLFLLWLIILPLLVGLLPLVLLAALILWSSGKGKIILHGYIMIFVLIWYMSGLRIDIRSTDNSIYVNLI